MNIRMRWNFLFLLLLLNTTAVFSQQLKFSVKDFSFDAFDLSARDERFQKIDGSGSLYAIIKVTSDSPDDNLRAYMFDFGNMNHLVEDHNGELWVYVQRNAKQVTIKREGYAPIIHYDLKATLESGKVYKMVLSAQGPIVYTQMVMFSVQPADSRAVINLTREDNGQETLLGEVNSQGAKAVNLPYGTYTYKIMAQNYFSSEGRFVLNKKSETHEEEVTLRPQYSSVTLKVDADADIFVNGEKKGIRMWSGILNAGVYNVECRQQNHKPSVQGITIEDNTSQTFDLTPPTPITGMLSVITDPLGASIMIDGKEYGETPCNIDNLLVGNHTVTLSRDNYVQEKTIVDVKEGEITELDLRLTDIPVNPTEKTFTVNGVNFVMKLVEGGTFMMGATEEQGSEARDNEKPVHQVTLDSYYIGETEVTQELWMAVMGSNPSHWKGSSLPVECVDWLMCRDFIFMLNQQTGLRFRLPTEAEWEYAARGGQKSNGYKYSGSNTIGDVAWYYGNSGGKTHAVKTKAANELGLYDMSGNVWEWCQDWYGDYGSSAQSNPTGASSVDYTVDRGGSWSFYAGASRVSYRRNYYYSVNRSSDLGLRLAIEVQAVNGALEKTVANNVPPRSNHGEDKTFKIGGVSFTMKAVEGGTFIYRQTKHSQKVTLNPFFIGETEVTQDLWQAVMGSNPSRWKGGNFPVEQVSWDDCWLFIRKLNQQTGQQFRLPSGIEWEYAARGGNKSRGYKYSGSNMIGDVAWYDGNSGSMTHPVKQKRANELGLYDMSGNVWEWCQDMSGKYEDGTTGLDHFWRMMRGGGCETNTRDCRISFGGVFSGDWARDNALGLRLAL